MPAPGLRPPRYNVAMTEAMIDPGKPGEGKLIVLTAPLTETIDHAGYFIQMALASLPQRMEGVINQKYPKWREVERNDDGSARYMPAGVRLVEASILRHFAAEDVVCCYPEDLSKFIGPRTRVIGVSTHNPRGSRLRRGCTLPFSDLRKSRSILTMPGNYFIPSKAASTARISR